MISFSFSALKKITFDTYTPLLFHFNLLNVNLLPHRDVARVSHRDSVNDYIRKGKMLERSVLWRAIQAHLQDRVTVYNNKCVVFGE